VRARSAVPKKASVAERLAAGDITESQAYELTREAALTSLDRAMQSRHSLENKLITRGYPAPLVSSVLARLVEVGLVDDAEYAQALVRVRADRGLATRAIAVELARKGVSTADAASALTQIDSTQQAASAEAIARKAVSRCHGLASEVKARRAYGAVSRRGYSREVATAVVAKVLGAELAADWA